MRSEFPLEVATIVVNWEVGQMSDELYLTLWDNPPPFPVASELGT